MLDTRLRAVCKTLGITFVSAIDLLCDKSGCLTRLGNKLPDGLVATDYDHYSAAASEFVIKTADRAGLLHWDSADAGSLPAAGQ